MIELKEINLKFSQKELFKNFSLKIEDNKITALIAPSGSGKTTLLNIISKLQKIDSGQVILKGEFAYLFQEPRLLPWLTIKKNIQIILENIYSKEDVNLLTEKYLKKIGLIERKNDYPGKLSGGEKQRVAMARAFAYPAEILLLDEAFQSQDLKLRIKLMELFEELLLENSRTVIMVTHDIREAFALADNILVLSGSPLKIVDTIINNSKQKNKSIIDRYLEPIEDVYNLEKKLLI